MAWPVSSTLARSLPCVRGGDAQRRWGCKARLIARSRETPATLQPLSRPSGRQLPLHRGADLSPKPPLCKGEVPRSGGGVVRPALSPVHGKHQQLYNPSVGLPAASSPYTGESLSAPELSRRLVGVQLSFPNPPPAQGSRFLQQKTHHPRSRKEPGAVLYNSKGQSEIRCRHQPCCPVPWPAQ